MGEDSDRPDDEDPASSEADESTTRISLDDEASDSDDSSTNPDESSGHDDRDEATTESDAADESDAVEGDTADTTESGDEPDESNADAESDATEDGTNDDADSEDADSEDADSDAGSEDTNSDDGSGDDAEDDSNDADDSTDTGDDADDATDDDDSEEDSVPLPDEKYEDQLEDAKETNPPLDREEVVDEEPIEASNGGAPSPGAAGSATADEGMFEGPESDEEMPLAVHIEEMMRRLGVVFLIGGIATLVAFPAADQLLNYFWASHIPAPWENRPRLYGPLEYILTKLKVAGLAGVLLGLPVFVYQTYRFMRPGLYPNERRYYLAAVPTSLVLGIIGGLFSHFLVLPAIFSYFTTYTEGAAVIAFGLAETFNLIIIMIAFMAVVFQIPLFIMLAIMMNLTSRKWLEEKRLLFWGSFFGIAFIFSPDPTGMAPIIVTLTMIILFEGTLALLRWTGN